MLAISGWPFLLYAAQLLLFVLFSIKFWGLCSEYVIPFLRKYRDQRNEQWTALQEQHLVLVSRKKQLATQFLQQEKQIALLTAKLESWHVICYYKQKERESLLLDRAQLMNERAAAQQHTAAQARLAAQAGQEIVRMVIESVVQNPEAFSDQYIERGCEQLSHSEKKDAMHESSYAKKTEGA